MSAGFIGARVSATLSDGKVIEGVVQSIDPAVGILRLTDALIRRFDNTTSPLDGGVLEINRASVKDLQLLALQSAAPPTHRQSQPGPAQAPVAHHTQAHYGQPLVQASISHSSTPEPGTSPAKKAAKRKNRTKKAAALAQALEDGQDTADSGYDDSDPLSKDFDFARGLQAFDKAKVWAEIASADSTDPATRLVSHNRKTKEEDPLRKLGNAEMVLSSEEQLVNGIATTSLSAPPPPLLETLLQKVRKTPISAHGVSVTPLTSDQITACLQSASIDTGPNLVQRVENGARAIASYAISILRAEARASHPYTVAILASGSLKASYALRAGAHLANRGCKVHALIVDGRPTPAFEAWIRLLLASGGEVSARLSSLPPSPDLIIDALADSFSTDGTPLLTAVDQAAVVYTHHKRVLSIDMPSNVSYDTGQILNHASSAPYATHLISLGGLPQGVLSLPSPPHVVCIADLSLPSRCYEEAGLKAWQAPWAHDWSTLVKLKEA